MNKHQLIKWLLQGDVSIQYQTHRDLLNEDNPHLKRRIEKEGWGAQYLSLRNSNGYWGRGFYQPKWTNTHYTLLDLRNLEISSSNAACIETCNHILNYHKDPDGGLNPAKTVANSDVCINGMGLVYCCYFHADEEHLKSIVDFLFTQVMPDGGFNCRLNRSGAKHSSLHTTISVLEGILEYKKNNYTYRLDELLEVEKNCQEFILQHRMFKSDKTGEIIDKKFLVLSYPSRWRYDILRALDYFQFANVHYDERMQDAIEILLKKKTKDNTWKLQAHHPGEIHFHMEKAGKPSRWNTLRAMRVLKHFNLL